MARVGIMSMQRIINYGSFLQAYGLKSILEGMGHEVQFVDYRVEDVLIERKTDQKRQKMKYHKIQKMLEAMQYKAPFMHKVQFVLYKKQFAGKYHSILGLTSEPNYTPKLDVLVIGSDEVFNCVQSNPNVGYSPELFGKGNRADKLLTYAASFGNTTMEKLIYYGKDKEVRALLQQFDAISVRDENAGEIVTNFVENRPQYHLDPVLVYDYMNVPGLIPQIVPSEKYLILYAYSGRISHKEAKWIAAYARKKKCKVYAIGGVQECADKFIDCSPFEVLAYFIHAEEVITDTFHGTIFSVITKRPFATLVRKSQGDSYGNEEKLTDLLNRLGLRSRSANLVEDVEAIQKEKIAYEKVEAVIQAERMKAVRYLGKEI